MLVKQGKKERSGLLLGAVLFAASPAAAASRASFPDFSVSTGAPLFSQEAATGVVVGQGGNWAVPLADGRTLWLLNNVMTGERKPDGRREVWDITDGAAALAPSTAPLAQAGSLAYVAEENGLPLPLLSGDLREYTQVRKFWPRSGLCSGGRCAVFYSIMNNFGTGPYDYFRVGQGVAVSESPAGPYVKARRDGRYSLWNDIEPAFGSALLEDADGWVYVYGRLMTSPGEYGAALARVRPGKPESRRDYSYYSVDTASGPWTSDVSEASVVMENVPDDMSVSYNEFLKSYLAVYLDEKTSAVQARLARAPWGPWGPPVRLFGCAAEDYCYGAREQPAFAADGGRRVFLTLERKNEPYLYEITFK